MQENQEQNRSKIKIIPLIIIKWIFIIAVWVGTCGSVYLLYVYHDLPSIDTLEQVKRERKATILDNQEKVISTYGDIYGRYVYYYDIPRNLRNAITSIEDKKFFDHWGIDVLGIMRAAVVNLKAGRTVQGGSTITQQLAKIVFLSNKRSFDRKLKELLLSIELEHKYTKQQILAIYLNRVYLGAGIYGIDAAAKYYFGKNIKDLSLYESAIIAGLVKAPSRFSPVSNPKLSGHRAYQVLSAMVSDGYVSKIELEKATTTPVRLNTQLLGSKKKNYFTEWVYEQVEGLVSEDDQDVIVKTTFDRKIENVASESLIEQLAKISKERKVDEGAVVIMDYNGEILSMVGGKNFNTSSFNRATQALRPPGSAFKTFVYATAAEQGYSSDDTVTDQAIKYGDWEPNNFHKNVFLGDISVNEAFIKSINTVAVQVAEKVGIRNVIKQARLMGIKSDLNPNLALALGGTSVTLLEMTGAYGSIANNGYRLNPHGIVYIRNVKTGEMLYTRPNYLPMQVLSEHSVEVMQTLLANTVQNGTARNANNNKVRISGKTGTSQDFRDAWFVGYTDKYIIGVWLGNDNYSPTKRVSGGTFPTIIARNILSNINKY